MTHKLIAIRVDFEELKVLTTKVFDDPSILPAPDNEVMIVVLVAEITAVKSTSCPR